MNTTTPNTDIRKEIENVMKERSTQSVKREKLLKIGLTTSDISQLFHADRMAKKIAKRERDEARRLMADTIEQIFARYTFGVEIECYNARPSELISKANAKGLSMQHEGYNHRDNNTYNNLVSDCSINGNDPIECVSPILNGNNGGLDTLKACCDALNEVGAMVNKSTGLHVHVGGQITPKQYVNTFVNYYYLESVIDTFMAPSRRNNSYAKKLNGGYISESELLAATTPREVCDVFHNNRYYKINVCSWSRHNTIEFRQHQGSTDYTKISNWARFCVRLVHWSESHRLTAPVASIDDIEFLTDEEKTYFKNRATKFAAQN